MGMSRARAVVAVALLLALGGVCASLAVWQYHRGRYKQQVDILMQARSTGASLGLTRGGAAALAAASAPRPPGASPMLDPFLYRPAQVRGRWVPEYRLFLDNRQHEGRQGVYVVMPLRIEGSPYLIAVVRGWLPRPDGLGQGAALYAWLNEQVPNDPAPVELSGTLARSVGNFARLPSSRGAPPFGGLWEYFDPVSYGLRLRAAKVPEMLLPYVLMQSGDTPPSVDPVSGVTDAAWVREWPSNVSDAPRHFGYAGQWLIFCLIAWGVALVIAWRARHPRAVNR